MQKAPTHITPDQVKSLGRELWQTSILILPRPEKVSLIIRIMRRRLRTLQLVAKIGPEVRGFIQFEQRENEYAIRSNGQEYPQLTKNVAYGLCVDSNYRGTGIGTALLHLGIQAVDHFNEDDGSDQSPVVTAIPSEGKEAFYVKNGFELKPLMNFDVAISQKAELKLPYTPPTLKIS